MGLHGSEYWTYFLPRRVGHAVAAYLTETIQPVLGDQALALHLVDRVLCADKTAFVDAVALAARELLEDGAAIRTLLTTKATERTATWFQTLDAHRAAELVCMRKSFASDAYATARRDFVLKAPLTATPPHLQAAWPLLTQKVSDALQASWDGSIAAGQPAAAAAFEGASGASLRAALEDVLHSH